MLSKSYASGYRYGFNGKENDKEVLGLGRWQDYGERQYRPDLGRFFSPDPLIVYGKKYTWYSPYQFAGNKPIWAIDLDGLEEALPKQNRAKTAFEIYTEKYGKVDIYNPNTIYNPNGKKNKSWGTDWSFEQTYKPSTDNHKSKPKYTGTDQTFFPSIKRQDDRVKDRVNLIISDNVTQGIITTNFTPTQDEKGQNETSTYQIGVVNAEGEEIILKTTTTNEAGSISTEFNLKPGENLFIRSTGGNTTTSVVAPVKTQQNESTEDTDY
ncbi:MAG: hypothetical protein Kow0079_16890 [Vicingaceae bacterium]